MAADKFKNIEKKSWIYNLLRFIVGIWHNYIFYEKYEIKGKENIPANDYKIFAPNHQNGLMDPLAVLYTNNDQTVFVARADLFKNKFIARILYKLKILPIFRMRDGKENLSENEFVFQKTKDVIVAKQPFTIFPEAAHNFKRELLSIKKGVPRIVFITEAENNYSLNIKIIPVGIYYDQYIGFRNNILVNIGPAFETMPYSLQSRESEPKAMLAMRDKLSVELEKLVLHIPHKLYYEQYETICEAIFQEVNKENNWDNNILYNELESKRLIVEKLNTLETTHPEEFNELIKKAELYKKIITDSGLSTENLRKSISAESVIGITVSLLALLPFQLIAFILYGPVVFLSHKIARIAKDISFYNTLLFPASLVLFYVALISGFFVTWILEPLAYYKWLWLVFYPIGFQMYFAWNKLFGRWMDSLKLVFNSTLRLKLSLSKSYFKNIILKI